MSNLDKTSQKFLALSAFFITLVYPPLVTYQFLNDTFRIVVFGTIVVGLLVIQSLRYYKKQKVSLIAGLWGIFIIYMSTSLYVNGQVGFISALGYAVILAFSISLFSIIKSERYEGFYNVILKAYTRFFFIVPIFSILNLLLNIVTPSFNILTSYLADNPYHYQVSPLGLVLPKPILGIVFSRSFFFFIEPVYLALFYLINIFIIGKREFKNAKWFVFLNMLGGIATFSYLFFGGYIILKILELKAVNRVLVISLLVAAYFAFSNMITGDLLESSSTDDRLFRIQTALEFIWSTNAKKIFFGIGIYYDYISNSGINAGILSTIIENGIIGLLLLITIMLILAQGNKNLIVIVFFALVTVEPFKLPLFWLSIILAGQLAKNKNEISAQVINPLTIQ